MSIRVKYTSLFSRIMLLSLFFFTSLSCTETVIERIKVQHNASILSGSGAPTRNTGKVGDYYIDVLTADFFGPKTKAGWSVTRINLLGEEGYGTVV